MQKILKDKPVSVSAPPSSTTSQRFRKQRNDISNHTGSTSRHHGLPHPEQGSGTGSQVANDQVGIFRVYQSIMLKIKPQLGASFGEMLSNVDDGIDLS